MVYESSPSFRDNRMHKIFETLQRVDVAQHKTGKSLGINSAFNDYARKNVFDRFCPIAGVEIAHCGIGVKDWRAQSDEHRSDS